MTRSKDSDTLIEKYRYCHSLCLATIFLLAISTASADTYEGVASCASSNCHGSAVQRKGDVLQNEYTTWFRHDKHSKAFTTLQTTRAKKMAEHLGIASAEKEPSCLSCHAIVSTSNEKFGEKFRIEDGVGCEACHGSASEWLRSHVEKGATHENNVANGMRDLKPYSERAKVCLSCHLGDDKKKIDHRIFAAGHPRLNFELDTFQAVMPKHWEEKEYDPINAWLVGLTVQAISRITSAESGKAFTHELPDFATLACTTCHHSLNKREFERRKYTGQLGSLKINLSEARLLSHVLSLLGLNNDKIKDLSSPTSELKEIIRDDILPKVKAKKISKDQSKQMFKELLNFYGPALDYETVEQLALGLSVISAANGNPANMKKEVDKIYSLISKNELP